MIPITITEGNAGITCGPTERKTSCWREHRGNPYQRRAGMHRESRPHRFVPLIILADAAAGAFTDYVKPSFFSLLSSILGYRRDLWDTDRCRVWVAKLCLFECLNNTSGPQSTA